MCTTRRYAKVKDNKGEAEGVEGWKRRLSSAGETFTSSVVLVGAAGGRTLMVGGGHRVVEASRNRARVASRVRATARARCGRE